MGIEQLALTQIHHTLFLSTCKHLKTLTNQAIEEVQQRNDRAVTFQLYSTFHTELIQTTGNDTLVLTYNRRYIQEDSDSWYLVINGREYEYFRFKKRKETDSEERTMGSYLSSYHLQ